jgi:eukaryotic-like serine/threonine-protein kinase
MDAELEPDDLVAQAVVAGSPAVDDIAAKLVRARVASALFGAKARPHVGRYELERQLGAGGGGIVFAAADPELSRRVALKLLAARSRRDQMLAEAHALARLAHPNVVPIFDVGTHEDQIFLVMELVEGGTLRTWLESAPRSIPDILRAYRDAGAGLAAAHRAGFIHRDFKPDNALVGAGDDHRVRVVDFGLVHVDGEARAGLGTPRYMPPEQASGGTITAAADQYSFCAALREAIRARKLDAAGTRADAIPRWIDDILARGLARDPASRWPSMDALLHALALDPAARWRRRGLVAGVLVLGAAAFIIGRAQSDSLPDCDGGTSELAKVWSPSVRDAIAAKLDALGTPYAREVKSKLTTALDDYAKSWSIGHLDACQMHQRGAQSDALFDRRTRCLDAAYSALTAATIVVREVAKEGLAQAVIATQELPSLTRCADQELLSTSITPPPPERALEVAALERELAAREVDVHAARIDVPALASLVMRARQIGDLHVLAKALRLRGLAAISGVSRRDAVPPLLQATYIAFAVHDDELAVECFARLAWARATSGVEDPSAVLASTSVAEAVAARLPDGARAVRVLLANNIASIEKSGSNLAGARAAYERAYREHDKVTGAMTVELAGVPANYALTIADPTRRDEILANGIARLTMLVGRSHPQTLTSRTIFALLVEDEAVAMRALDEVCTEYVTFHPNLGADIGNCALELAWFALNRGDAATARRWFTALVEAGDHEGRDSTTKLATAHLLRLDGDVRGAIRSFTTLRDEFDKTRTPFWYLARLIEADLGLALAQRDAGQLEASRASLQHARPLLVTILASDPIASHRRRLRRIDDELRGSR